MRLLLGSVFFFLLQACAVSWLSAQNALFETLTIEQGLSQGMVFDLCQTRDGFLWVATKDGLNRYDGYNFKVYSHSPLDSFSLAEDNVTALFEDSRGLLWVGLESKGIDVYDPKTGRFHHCPLNFEHDQKPADFDVYAICEAADGAICLLQKANGMVRIPVPDGYLRQEPGSPDWAYSLKASLFPTNLFGAPTDAGEIFLTAVRPQPDGSLQVYTNRRYYQVVPDRGLVTPLDAGRVSDDFWVALPFDFARCRNGVVTPQNLSSSGKVKWAMATQDADGSSWVAFNNKLWHLLPGESPDISNPDWVVDEDISSAMADRNGNIWVGTQGYGLRKFNPKKQRFNTGANGTSIWGLWRDTRGKYYCKVVNEVFTYDPQSKTLSNQHAFPQGPDRVLDMWIEPSGDIWLLGRNNEENGMGLLQHYTPDATLLQTFQFTFKPYVYARLIRSRSGHFWITGTDCQLVRFTPGTAQFDYFSYASLFGGMSRAVRALALAEDGNGLFWLGTQEGLVRFNAKTFDFQLVQADPKNPNSLNNNAILCLLPDPIAPQQMLWIGTKGGGINRLDLQNNQFQHLTPADGLPDKVVYSILPGYKTGEFWCSTNRGLVKLTLANNQLKPALIATFGAAIGLQDNEFNTQAFFKASNGELLFGGVNGLNRFFPEMVRPDTLPPPVFIVGLEINRAPATSGTFGLLDKPLERLQELNLRYDQNNLSFEFAALDFTDPAKNRYRYRLVGIDADWVEVSNRRFAHYNHLAAGRYTFYVQGNNGEGNWQNAVNSITVVIHPPWWRTKLAYAFYAALFLWAAWQAYRFQVRRVQLREQIAYEHREIERVKALEQMKTNFFSNITHEFRTPLTLILEPVRRILAKTKEPETRDSARLIEANSARLLNLVNQLLDMAKLESGSMALDLRCADLGQTIRDVFETFLPLAEKRGVKLVLKQEAQGLQDFHFDPGKVELVLNNLISNSLKFTPEGGQVEIICRNEAPAASHPEARSGVQISVRDTGIGIPTELQDKIFDRFYQVDGSQTRTGGGTGIGLALSKELAELMGGGIAVKSEVGKGATFMFWLPAPSSLSNGQEMASRLAAPYLADAPLPDPENQDERVSTAQGEPGGRSIALVIEDNTELRRFITQSIGSEWQVAQASDGEEGIKKAIELLPDLVITDLMMPRKDGYDVCDELKNNPLTAHIPIIMLTAKAGIDSKVKGLRMGADDYLTKPFNTEELLARMENLVEIRRRLREQYGKWPQSASPTTEDALPDFLSAPDREFLRRFNLLLEQHLSDETLSVEDFASKMFVSRVQLYRKLKALTDRSATDLIRDYRLDRAYAMLQNREGLIYEVAAKVGFGNEKYFSKAFKEKFGVLPSQLG